LNGRTQVHIISMMMTPVPQLAPMAQQVLRIVLERGMMDGAELMRSAEVKRANELTAPIKELKEKDLIEVRGDIVRETALPFATLSVQPSRKEYLYSVLQQQATPQQQAES